MTDREICDAMAEQLLDAALEEWLFHLEAIQNGIDLSEEQLEMLSRASVQVIVTPPKQ